jgi:probable HAF family extracellular repeat protein
MEPLGDLPGAEFFSSATEVSADGSVVVGYSKSASSGNNDYEAFRWTDEGGMEPLGDLPGGRFYSNAQAVSADGSVAVGFSSSASGTEEAFRWTASGGMEPLGDLPGGDFYSEAYDISADGSTIVGRGHVGSVLGFEAFRWTADEGMQGLGQLPGGVSGNAFGVSADGTVVVGYGTVMSGEDAFNDAFIWDADHGMRSLRDVLQSEFGLDLTGWTLGGASAISDDGLTIVGSGTNPSGYTEAWIAHIPEPSTVLLLAFGLVALAAARRRR